MVSKEDDFNNKAIGESSVRRTVNRREFTRVPVVLEAEVITGQSTIRVHHTKDISMNGIFLVAEEKLSLHTNCYLTLFLGDRQSQQQIKVRGRVVRLEDEGMAFFFEEILGAESYIQLRNLLLYNAPDTEIVEEEVETHLGIKRRV
jgi:hypothetical protein